MYDVQRSSKVIPSKIAMWAFYPSQMFTKKDLKGEIIL
mgnify:CR=1 FL=1